MSAFSPSPERREREGEAGVPPYHMMGVKKEPLFFQIRPRKTGLGGKAMRSTSISYRTERRNFFVPHNEKTHVLRTRTKKETGLPGRKTTGASDACLQPSRKEKDSLLLGLERPASSSGGKNYGGDGEGALSLSPPEVERRVTLILWRVQLHLSRRGQRELPPFFAERGKEEIRWMAHEKGRGSSQARADLDRFEERREKTVLTFPRQEMRQADTSCA